LSDLRGGDTLETLGVIGLLVAIVRIIAFIVCRTARRRIPVSYAKRPRGPAGGRRTTDDDAAEDQHGWGLSRSSLHRRFFRCSESFAAFHRIKQAEFCLGKHLDFLSDVYASDPYYELIFFR